MTRKQAKQLHSGDEVYWNDPDDGKCSRYLQIQTVKIIGSVIRITETNGAEIEVFSSELS